MTHKSLVILLSLLGLLTSASSADAEPLRVLSSNPRYFTDGSGRAIYLTGSHVHQNLQDLDSASPPAPYDYTAYLDRISRLGHNFMRMWSWESTRQRNLFNGNVAVVEPTIWMRTGSGIALDGRPQFDLTRLNQAYFDRMRSRVVAARDKGIYVSVMLFEGWMLQFMEQEGHPFQPDNNINGINGDPDGDRRPTEAHRVSLNSPIGEIQKEYVRKVIDTLNDLDNVLYEIANEDGGGTVQWQYDLINYIKSYEAGKPKQHPVGMTHRYDGGTNEELFASPADWISPGGSFPEPPAADGRKVIVSDTDHMSCDSCTDGRDWVWRTFARGGNPIFMDYPASEIFEPAGGIFEPIRERMGQTLAFANRMNLATMTPRGDLSSTAYALSNPGSEYLIYQPTGSSFTVNLVSGSYTYEWFNPATGRTAETGNFTAATGNRSFTSPFSGDAVLYLRSGTPGPMVTGLSPSSAAVGATAFTLTVTGSNFAAGSVVRWNGADRPTTYQNAGQLTAAIGAADIAAAGPAAVTVFDPAPGGGTSNALTFTVANPVPIASTLSPGSVIPGAAAFTLTVTGSNFGAGSVVRWNGADRPTTYQAAGQLTAAIGAADIAAAGPAAVTVFNPTPGGGTSNTVTFTVASANPVQSATTLTVSATSVASGTAVTVTLQGGAGGGTDWLGLAPVGAPNTTYVAWTYVGAGVTTRTWTVPVGLGSWEFRLFLNNGYTRVATSPPVVASASLTVGAASVAPGTAVTVTLHGGAGGGTDWLGLAPVGAPDTTYVAWTYVGPGVTTRTWTVPVGLGSWEFRLFLNNGYTRVATSPPVATPP